MSQRARVATETDIRLSKDRTKRRIGGSLASALSLFHFVGLFSLMFLSRVQDRSLKLGR
jgi:hypothetical protein